MAKKRGKQGYLDGLEPPSVPAIDRAAEAYVSTRNERMELTELEVEKHAALLEQMNKAGLTTYTYDGYVVNVLSTSKVKVKKSKEPGEAEEE